MLVFWLNLIIVLIASLIASTNENDNSNCEEGYTKTKPSRFFVMIASLSMILVSGLRIPYSWRAIGDTYSYHIIFFTLPMDINKLITKYLSAEDGWFYIFTGLIKIYIANDTQVIFFICAMITIGITMIAFYKFAEPFYLAPFLFITWGAYLVSMNGVRQSLVAAVILLMTGWIINGKWAKFFVVIFILGFFHQSALMYIPLYFIVRGKAWSKKNTLILIVSAIGFIGFNYFLPMFFGALGDTQYGHYQKTFDGSFGGANYIRAILSAVPVLMAYISRKRLAEIWKYSDIFVNFSILNCIIMFFATYNWIFARMSVYLNLYNFILMPYVLKAYFEDEDSRKFYTKVLIVLFVVYYYYEMVISLNMKYFSNYINF